MYIWATYKKFLIFVSIIALVIYCHSLTSGQGVGLHTGPLPTGGGGTQATQGDDVKVNGASTVNPDFDSGGQVDFTNTSNTITADVEDNSILEADLKAVNAATDEDILTYESTTGDFEWQTGTETNLANRSLNNLDDTSVNKALIPDSDGSYNMGSFSNRWGAVFGTSTRTSKTASDTYKLIAYDTDDNVWVEMGTLTAGTIPSLALSDGTTGVTRPSGDNSTKLATTAYADAVAGGAPTDATYITQTVNASLSAEQALSGESSGIMKNTTGTGVISIVNTHSAFNDEITDAFMLAGHIGTITSGFGGIDVGTDTISAANFLTDGVLGVGSISASSGSVTINSPFDFQDKVLMKPVIIDWAEAVGSVSASGASVTIDYLTASVHDITLTANTTITFENPPGSGFAGAITLYLRQDGTGSRTVTWTNVKWASGTAPTLTTTAGALDIITIATVNGGASYQGFETALDVK